MAAPTEEEDSKNNSSEDEEGEDEVPPPQDGGFSLAPVGDSPMTRAISGIDPKMARRMTAMEVKDATPRGKQWWKDVLPKFAERAADGEDESLPTERRRSTVVISDPSQRDIAQKIKNGTSTESDITNFFAKLKIKGKDGEVQHDTKTKKNWKKITRPKVIVDKVKSGPGFTREVGQAKGEERKGIEFIDYRFVPMRGYTTMPEYLLKALEFGKIDYYLLIGRPTLAPGAGLAGYKEVTTRKERLMAPVIGVFDHPGMLDDFEDDGYSWLEVPLGDTFMLDVSEMKTKEDYPKVLSKKRRQDYKTKMKKFDKEPNIRIEIVDWVGTEENIDMIWPLYAATGEKNGFTVLTKEEFYRYHRIVPDQKVAYVWDVSDPENKKLVSFNTAFIWKDIIHPMWCGTDYDNPLNRSCSTYFIILYSYAHYAIEQPGLNWVDLGATQRKAKTSIGYKPFPCSCYFRCLNSFSQMVIEYSMEKYYDPEKCMTDP